MLLACERWPDLTCLVARFELQLQQVGMDDLIPGSYWGAPEAGLVGHRVFARDDTPVHSVLHESAHAVCMTATRRAQLHTDAGGDDIEENAVCYLQILLAGELYDDSQLAICADMDAWGYSFRLGSARAWFEQDAQDARAWLQQHKLIDQNDQPTFEKRS